ncbi:MAG: peptidylprolyl isomerase, partial [Bacteroidia bacterium]
TLIRKDSISATEAASRFSDDEETKHNGGLITNPATGNTRFEMDQLSQVDPNLALTISSLKAGEPTAPSATQTRDGKPAFHIIYVKDRTEPHHANLKQDYQRIQDETLADKKEKVIRKWINKKITVNYIHVSDEYKSCKFESPWIN